MQSNWNITPRSARALGKAMALGAIVATALPVSSATAGTPRVVVELFTSQGCSSCPPANANLIELSKRDDVLPLSFAVTYWDYLGWKDTFSRTEYTDRQVAYEPNLGKSGPFTPQIVINGSTSLVGNRLEVVQQSVDAAKPLAGPTVQLDAAGVQLGGGLAAAQADVWLVRYDPNLVEVPIARGENTGRTLPHTHVVHSLERLGSWNGAAVSFTLPAEPEGLKTAVLVQVVKGGAILSAVTD